MSKITFIGLGAMGAPMAQNLLAAGHSLCVFDLSLDAMSRLEASGSRIGRTPLDAVEDAEIVITMLPDDSTIRDLYLGASNVLAAVPKGALLIDCSTISIEATRELAAAALAHDLRIVDAPVSGGVWGAQEATLTFMVGGETVSADAATPILKAMGKAVIHVGASGAGQAAKICNNMLAGIIMAASAETLALGARNGLDPALLTSIIQISSGGNFLMDRWNPWPGVHPDSPASAGYAGGFQLQLMMKDMSLAIKNAEVTQSSVPLAAVARHLYAMRGLKGEGDSYLKDFSCIQELYGEIKPTGPAPAIAAI